MGRGNPVESKGRGCLVKPKVGGPNVEPTGRRAETERDDLRLESDPLDQCAQARMVVLEPETRRECLALQEMVKG